MNDLHEIKKWVFDNDKIEYVLEKLDCWKIKPTRDSWIAARPDGDNQKGVQVYKNEYLNCALRSRGFSNKLDIFGVISYIKFDATTEKLRSETLNKAKLWLLNILGLSKSQFHTEEKKDENGWLRKLKKRREPRFYFNETIDSVVFEKYEMLPCKKWVEEGVHYQTQLKFGVGYDPMSDRMVFPVHNRFGDLIGVKGRYCGSDEYVEDNFKYLYLHPCDKSIELYNFHRALPYIMELGEVIIFEGAKTVWFADQYGIQNTVSIEGDHITEAQIKLLKSLGCHIKLKFAWDKGKDVDFIKEQTKSLVGWLAYSIYDTKDLLEDKDSPMDKGAEKWNKLYNENCYRIHQ